MSPRPPVREAPGYPGPAEARYGVAMRAAHESTSARVQRCSGALALASVALLACAVRAGTPPRDDAGASALARSEELARADVRAASEAAQVPFALALGPDALVAGPVKQSFVDELAAGLVRGRAWFDAAYEPPRGIELFAGRRAELYVFLANEPYLATVPWFAARTPALPQGWSDAVLNAHAFFCLEPVPVASVRRWYRPEAHVAGHTYHQWGHLLVAWLGGDGRLLPAWYEEGVAALVEFRTHGRNDGFCRGAPRADAERGPATGEPAGEPAPPTKTKRGASPPAARAPAEFDARSLAAGTWRASLQQALAAGNVAAFDRLATRDFGELDWADIATAMAIVEWLEAQHGLRAFHAALRKTAPPAPLRVHAAPYERVASYEAAFQAAVKLSTHEADEAWRRWFPSR